MLFGIFIYDGVEPIDLATFGVLSMARRIAPHIRICTIAPKAGIVQLMTSPPLLWIPRLRLRWPPRWCPLVR